MCSLCLNQKKKEEKTQSQISIIIEYLIFFIHKNDAKLYTIRDLYQRITNCESQSLPDNVLHSSKLYTIFDVHLLAFN